MTKFTSLHDAIHDLVSDGASVVVSAALEALIPFAAGHEMIRQQKRDLTLIAPISDVLFDQLIGAGCVVGVKAAWVGNVSAGLGHNYRRAAENRIPRAIEIEDHSNFSIALALLAGGLGVPYVPTRSLLGTDILRTNRSLMESTSPFGDERLVLVQAIIPDVAILHVQRSDEEGNAHAWGNLGVTRDALMASKSTILIAEEIVSREVIRSDPNRVLGPSQHVAAVVHEPGGAHPAPVQGHYNRDHAFFHEYHAATRTVEGWEAWRHEWIDEIPDRHTYLEKLGERWQALQRRESRLASPVDYGY